jgi:hypothetical protein
MPVEMKVDKALVVLIMSLTEPFHFSTMCIYIFD